jgi:hypothetical protein
MMGRFDHFICVPHFGQVAHIRQYVELLQYIETTAGVFFPHFGDLTAGIMHISEYNRVGGTGGLTGCFGIAVFQRTIFFLGL